MPTRLERQPKPHGQNTRLPEFHPPSAPPPRPLNEWLAEVSGGEEGYTSLERLFERLEEQSRMPKKAA